MNRMFRTIWSAASETYVAVPETTRAKGRRGCSAIVAAGAVSVFSCAPGAAQAAVVSACSGVALPPSVVTNIVGTAVLPVTGILDSALGLLLGPLGLSTNLTNTLASIAAGNPIQLNVLDVNGQIVNQGAPCETVTDTISLKTPKGISIGGNKITGLGATTVANAGELNSIAFGNGAVTNAAALNSIAIGPNASIGAAGSNSVALGSGASATVANSVALGAGSTAATGAQTGYTAFGLTAPQTSFGEVSVGSTGNNRKITNVAAGSSAFDAVNVAQLTAVDNGAVKYDNPALKLTVTLGGPLSTDGGVNGGTTITNVHQGALNATSTDAVNGSQLYATNLRIDNIISTPIKYFHANSAAADSVATGAESVAIGPLSVASGASSLAAGNGATTNAAAANSIAIGPNASTGAAGSNSVALGSAASATAANSVALGAGSTAVTGAQAGYTAFGLTAPQTSVGEVSVGAAGSNRKITNVSAGSSAFDAVNVAQLTAVNNGSVKYDNPATKTTVTLGGPASTDGGVTNGTTITNVHQGALNATSTDAVNGAQLYATNVRIDNIVVTPTKYFHANSAAADSVASGAESVAIGPLSVASGASSLAAGNGAASSGSGSIAVGQNSTSSGVNSIAIGTGAVATGSVAVGAGAQAGLGGAAFGDNAVALTGQQGTALGNGATVTANQGVAIGSAASATAANSVALGAGSVAATGAQTGYTAFGLAAPQTSVGEVSVGVAGSNRKITNVSAGSSAFDAVNVAQLTAVDNGSVKYDNPATKTTVTLGGTGGTTIKNLAPGVAPNDAVNVSQLGSVTVNVDALGQSVATNLGGGSTYNTTTHVVSAPSYTVYGTTQNNVGAAITALQTSSPVQYSNSSGVPTPNTPSNHVTLVGSTTGPVTVHNVANGVAPTDAVNKSQLDAAIIQPNVDIYNQINQLRSEVGDVRRDANAGSASALAAASMPQASFPGKSMVAAGVSNFQGESAIAVGLSNLSDNGRWVVKFNGSTNTRGKTGVGAGVGFNF